MLPVTVTVAAVTVASCPTTKLPADTVAVVVVTVLSISNVPSETLTLLKVTLPMLVSRVT